jgi:hypothetical protein
MDNKFNLSDMLPNVNQTVSQTKSNKLNEYFKKEIKLQIVRQSNKKMKQNQRIKLNKESYQT